MVRCLFLLIHFLVVQDYKLAKSTSHILSVPLNVECFRVLSWCIFFFSYFNCLFDHVQCKITIWAVDNALNSSQDKPSDLSEQIVIWSKNYENAIPEISENAILYPIIYWYLGNFLYLQANWYRLKTKNINGLIFIRSIK